MLWSWRFPGSCEAASAPTARCEMENGRFVPLWLSGVHLTDRYAKLCGFCWALGRNHQ
jgi:hypothetical protein